MKTRTLKIIGFTALAAVPFVVYWIVAQQPQTKPTAICCTCGYTVIEKGVHVNNCGDTVIVEKFKFDKQFNSQN